MPVLQSNEILVPFFSRPMTFVRGLDPLGLQNTSEATFAMLLPGLNNVTGRIRYYSLAFPTSLLLRKLTNFQDRRGGTRRF